MDMNLRDIIANAIMQAEVGQHVVISILPDRQPLVSLQFDRPLIEERDKYKAALQEIHILAADAQLRATYQKTALEQISAKAQDALKTKK